jgi:hypothetical protein
MDDSIYKVKVGQVNWLHTLGDDCWNDFQYIKAEKIYQSAIEISEKINNLSLIIREKFCLATMQKMQGKHKVALVTYSLLLEILYNPI